MEFDSALSQMFSLIVKPSVVSKMSKARNMTKDHFYRDDPAFLVFQFLFFVLSVMSYHFALGSGFFSLLYFISVQIFVYYLLFGVIVATGMLAMLNKYFLRSTVPSEVRREVEWRYCFDVHCNGYFVYFIWTKVIPYLMLPFILKTSFVPRVLANLLYLVGLSSYINVVFQGYLELPMITHQEKLMYPIAAFVFVILVITLFTSWNLIEMNVSSFWPPTK
ncbi:hypothetical protein AGDE_07903 [Angomonas deanei]|nr:hypothetical protein AGDE_07903 [Angomonas deanei]|eukprot:EPY34463.1 hypothetical protein AGDE_07903 [Angomonas deanei]